MSCMCRGDLWKQQAILAANNNNSRLFPIIQVQIPLSTLWKAVILSVQAMHKRQQLISWFVTIAGYLVLWYQLIN